MKKILAISIASASIAIGAIPALAEIDPKIHKLCLDAKDYSGCVKTISGNDESVNNQSSMTEKCWGDGLERACLAKEGIDNLGMPKLVNWFYDHDAAGNISYWEADLVRTKEQGVPKYKRYFIPHKGQKRYWGVKYVMKYFVNAQPGYSGSSTTIGSASTSCTAYGGQAFCNTTPAATINIPGRSAQPAQIKSYQGLYVYDCKDKTEGYYTANKKGKGWQKNSSIPSCSNVPFEEFEILNFKL